MSAGYRLLATALGRLRAYGPYILVEMLLPGGTLLALLLWLSQHLGGMGPGSVYRYLLAQRDRAAVAAQPHALEYDPCCSVVESLPTA